MVKSKYLSPIVIFAYNRPSHLKATIEALKKNDWADKSELFVYSDGPKNYSDEDNIKEIRKTIRNINGFKSVTVIERTKNYGLANSIIHGVAEVIGNYNKAIVIEDDILTSRNFLVFMNTALERYNDEHKVMQISGYMFPVMNQGSKDTFFLPMTSSWGWATWNRAWSKFDVNTTGYQALKNSKKLKKAFDLENAYPFFRMLENRRSGKNNSWAILWYLCVFLNKGLVLYPKKSLCKNIGFDNSGTHCGEDISISEQLLDKWDPEVDALEKIVSVEVLNLIKGYLKAQKRSSKNISKVKKWFIL